jgi:hypothetical protein
MSVLFLFLHNQDKEKSYITINFMQFSFSFFASGLGATQSLNPHQNGECLFTQVVHTYRLDSSVACCAMCRLASIHICAPNPRIAFCQRFNGYDQPRLQKRI